MEIRLLLCASVFTAQFAFGNPSDYRVIRLNKCCGWNEMLDETWNSCVQVSGQRRNIPASETLFLRQGIDIISYAFNGTDVVHPHFPYGKWLREWIPPPSPDDLVSIGVATLKCYFEGVPVNSSSFRNEEYILMDHATPMTITKFSSRSISLQSEGNSIRAEYCVDDTQHPHAPFAFLFHKLCDREDKCLYKCCPAQEFLVTDAKGISKCVKNTTFCLTKPNSSLAHSLDLNSPNIHFRLFEEPELEHFQTVEMHLQKDYDELFITEDIVDRLFSTRSHECFDLERQVDGHEREVMGFLYFSRIPRGLYWVTRNFSFVSALLLVAALASVACSPRMRRTVHGKALACHATCLLLFNLGQLIFYFSLSEPVLTAEILNSMEDRLTFCTVLASGMYFVQMGAALWMTAVCGNMAAGFRRMRVVLPGRSHNKTFLIISAFAWGTALALTTVCVILFPAKGGRSSRYEERYHPTFAETRTCFSELVGKEKESLSS